VAHARTWELKPAPVSCCSAACTAALPVAGLVPMPSSTVEGLAGAATLLLMRLLASCAARSASREERWGEGPGERAVKADSGLPMVAALRFASASAAAEAAAAARASGDTKGLQAGTRSSSRLQGAGGEGVEKVSRG
jgi:hypothetical protein